MDDVMRKMMERFSGEKGFTGKDAEQAVADICGCDVQPFFTDYVRGNKPIDLNKYLRVMGVKYTLSRTNVLGQDQKPAADQRFYSWIPDGENNLRIMITDPESCWGKAGLHTGDIIVSVNAVAVKTPRALGQIIRNVKIGDTVSVELQRPAGLFKTNVIVAGYKQPLVRIDELASPTQKQQGLYRNWISGN